MLAKSKKFFRSAQSATETYNQAAIIGHGSCAGGRFLKVRWRACAASHAPLLASGRAIAGV
jgi:hypothetical protein